MPTVPPTPPSPPVRTPPATTRSARTPDASKPSFTETLREKRRTAGGDAIADPAVRSQPSESAPDTAGPPESAGPATAGERQGNAATPAGTAQPGGDDAQSLPTAARGAVAVLGAMHTESVVVRTTGENLQPGPTGAAAEAPGPTPTGISQPGSGQAFVNPTAATPAGQLPAASGAELPVQQGPTGVDQPQALRQGPPAAPPPGPGHASAEGLQQSPGTGADARPGGGLDEESASRHHPALGRAMQVQASVAVENATGLTPPGGMNTVASVTGLVNADVPAPPAPPAASPGFAGLALDDAQATGRVVRGLTSMLAARGGTMTMRLEPPGLGQLRVQMTIVRGTVTAQFQPATAEAQTLLERSLGTLRMALESQGLTVERLTVHAAPPSPLARETADDQSQQQHASRHHADAGDGRSRGRGDDESGHDSPKHRLSASFADAIESFAGDSPGSLDDIPQGAEAA